MESLIFVGNLKWTNGPEHERRSQGSVYREGNTPRGIYSSPNDNLNGNSNWTLKLEIISFRMLVCHGCAQFNQHMSFFQLKTQTLCRPTVRICFPLLSFYSKDVLKRLSP